jgi:hypothetical protein
VLLCEKALEPEEREKEVEKERERECLEPVVVVLGVEKLSQ